MSILFIISMLLVFVITSTITGKVSGGVFSTLISGGFWYLFLFN